VGARLTLGDFIYTLGLPMPLHSLKTLAFFGRIAAPFVVNMSFDNLNPSVTTHYVIMPKNTKYYFDAAVRAVYFLYTRRYLP
jgi:hypothetical protein